jgi:hypothetical protein
MFQFNFLTGAFLNFWVGLSFHIFYLFVLQFVLTLIIFMSRLKNKFNTSIASTHCSLFLTNILKFKEIVISLVLCFLIFLIVFANYNTFFVFCDNECQLIVEVNSLSSDKNLFHETALTSDHDLIEKLKSLEEKLKECQEKTKVLQAKAEKSSSLGLYLLGVLTLMFVIQWNNV